MRHRPCRLPPSRLSLQRSINIRLRQQHVVFIRRLSAEEHPAAGHYGENAEDGLVPGATDGYQMC